jgi:glutamine cyclotransferase
MRIATFACLASLGLALLPSVVGAGLPEGKIAVVRVTAVDGLAYANGAASESRLSAFAYDGTEYTISKSALGSTDGVQTLLLIEPRDERRLVARHFSHEVRAFSSTAFEVKDVQGKVLAYQVAMIGGNLRLLGDSDQIQAKAGSGGPFSIWKVTGIDLVDQSAIVLN